MEHSSNLTKNQSCQEFYAILVNIGGIYEISDITIL
jgi:hypothetical protein